MLSQARSPVISVLLGFAKIDHICVYFGAAISGHLKLSLLERIACCVQQSNPHRTCCDMEREDSGGW